MLPVDRRRIVGRDVDTLLSDTFTEHPESDSVVLVRFRGFLGVVFGVNPANDTLSFAPDLECGGQVVVVGFDYDRTLTEQFLRALFPVCVGEESHAGVEGEEQVGVGLGDIPLAGFELFPESIELPFGVSYRLRINGY